VPFVRRENLNIAFKKTRGKTLGQYRQWSKPFA